jgi:hypothetical protein
VLHTLGLVGSVWLSPAADHCPEDSEAGLARWRATRCLCSSLLAPPSWVLVVLVWITQLCGWSPHCCVTRCSCYVTAAWLGPAPLFWVLVVLVLGTQLCAWLGPAPPSWVLVVLVWITQLYGWFSHLCQSRCSCYVTAAWLGPAPPFLGAGGSSVGDSAAWLGSSLACYSLLVLSRQQCRGLSCMTGPLAGVLLSSPS